MNPACREFPPQLFLIICLCVFFQLQERIWQTKRFHPWVSTWSQHDGGKMLPWLFRVEKWIKTRGWPVMYFSLGTSAAAFPTPSTVLATSAATCCCRRCIARWGSGTSHWHLVPWALFIITKPTHQTFLNIVMFLSAGDITTSITNTALSSDVSIAQVGYISTSEAHKIIQSRAVLLTVHLSFCFVGSWLSWDSSNRSSIPG